jgi:imidazole glycerol-phosphate synthase subunit HisF
MKDLRSAIRDPRSAASDRPSAFEVMPSLDIIGKRVVRLSRGDFGAVTDYGTVDEVVDQLDIPAGTRLHVVDLEGSRDGKPGALEAVRYLVKRDYRVQVGGGVRTLRDARLWFDTGAERLVVGTVTADDPQLLTELVNRFGAARIVPAVDLHNGAIRVAGWTRHTETPLDSVLPRIERTGIQEILVTDIGRDGVLAGPSLALYRSLAKKTRLRVIASGGVAAPGDIVSLARLQNVSGCVVGRAFLDRRFTFDEAVERAAAPNTIPDRIIPCLDIRDGRVVKGVSFAGIRDAGDPVECVRRYEAEGADEIVVLDISATDRGVSSAIDTIRAIAEAIFIPLTVGGGVRTIEDFRALLRAGADRVAINTAAVRRPDLIAGAAKEFGVQAVVLSCDAKRTEDRQSCLSGFEVMVRSGKENTGIDVVDWCRRAAELGAGEILLTSVDRDGTSSGYDIELLRAVTGAVRISVIASGGAGALEHFREAIAHGGARAVLAASLFHDRSLTIGEVKTYLGAEGIPVR